VSRDQGRTRGERLNDGWSAVAAGQGPPLVILPGFGPGADLAVRVPRSAAWSAAALARGFRRRIHLIHRPVDPPAGMTIAALAGWHATALRERFGQPVDVSGQQDADLRIPGVAGQVGKQGGRVRAGVDVVDEDQGRVTAGPHGGQGGGTAPGMQPSGGPGH
jgi:hypothetical protein